MVISIGIFQTCVIVNGTVRGIDRQRLGKIADRQTFMIFELIEAGSREKVIQHGESSQETDQGNDPLQTGRMARNAVPLAYHISSDIGR